MDRTDKFSPKSVQIYILSDYTPTTQLIDNLKKTTKILRYTEKPQILTGSSEKIISLLKEKNNNHIQYQKESIICLFFDVHTLCLGNQGEIIRKYIQINTKCIYNIDEHDKSNRYQKIVSIIIDPFTLSELIDNIEKTIKKDINEGVCKLFSEKIDSYICQVDNRFVRDFLGNITSVYKTETSDEFLIRGGRLTILNGDIIIKPSIVIIPEVNYSSRDLYEKIGKIVLGDNLEKNEDGWLISDKKLDVDPITQSGIIPGIVFLIILVGIIIATLISLIFNWRKQDGMPILGLMYPIIMLIIIIIVIVYMALNVDLGMNPI